MLIPYHFTKEGRGVLITKLNDHPNTRFILFSDADPDSGGGQYGYYTDDDGDRRESYSLHPSADPPWFECNRWRNRRILPGGLPGPALDRNGPGLAFSQQPRQNPLAWLVR